MDKNIKIFTCQFPHCQKSFISSSNFKAHQRTHTGERPYVCICQKTFTTLGNLKTHQLIHSDTRPFVCPFPQCKSKFRQAVNLKAHIRTHTKEKPFRCLADGCQKYFTALSSVRRHVRNYHYQSGPIPKDSYIDLTKSAWEWEKWEYNKSGGTSDSFESRSDNEESEKTISDHELNDMESEETESEGSEIESRSPSSQTEEKLIPSFSFKGNDIKIFLQNSQLPLSPISPTTTNHSFLFSSLTAQNEEERKPIKIIDLLN